MWRANEIQAGKLTGGKDASSAFEINTGAAKAQCPSGLMCHLVHVHP